MDGGSYDPIGIAPIGGVRRYRNYAGMHLEVDGETVYDLPSAAVYDIAAKAIQFAGIGEVRQERQVAA